MVFRAGMALWREYPAGFHDPGYRWTAWKCPCVKHERILPSPAGREEIGHRNAFLKTVLNGLGGN